MVARMSIQIITVSTTKRRENDIQLDKLIRNREKGTPLRMCFRAGMQKFSVSRKASMRCYGRAVMRYYPAGAVREEGANGKSDGIGPTSSKLPYSRVLMRPTLQLLYHPQQCVAKFELLL